jgi:hypothetical protein
MRSERIPVSKLNSAAYNPRKDLKPGDAEYDKLANSIEAFGYIEPIVWNERTGNVVGGHQRLKVLAARGMDKIECVVVDYDEMTEKAANVALNKISGDWDFSKLADLLLELDEFNFDMDLTGFGEGEIKNIMTWCPGGDSPNDPEAEWQGMPEYDQETVKPYHELTVRFACEDDYQRFAGLVEQKLTEKTKSIWYPKQDFDQCNRDKVYTVDES